MRFLFGAKSLLDGERLFDQLNSGCIKRVRLLVDERRLIRQPLHLRKGPVGLRAHAAQTVASALEHRGALLHLRVSLGIQVGGLRRVGGKTAGSLLAPLEGVIDVRNVASCAIGLTLLLAGALRRLLVVGGARRSLRH